MMTAVHSEVLAHDWLPPVALGRTRDVGEVVRRLDPPRPHAPPPWLVAVAGPSGSGTTTVARRAAREVVERVRSELGEPFPRLLTVRTSLLRGTHGVVTALLQRIDDGFDGRGFPVPEILAGLLRRLRRDARPSVLVLDDISLGGPDLAPIVRAVAAPDRFLPEGEFGIPPLWAVLAGTSDALRGLERSLAPKGTLGPFVEVTPYGPDALRSIVTDRAERALGQMPPGPLVERVVRRAVEDGGGARRAVDLLRRELLGVSFREIRDGVVSARLRGIDIEPWVVRAIGAASKGRTARLGEIRRLETELAIASGARPLPTTTLWRRIVRLEQAGYVRREIRPGGMGGTLSVLRVLTPIDEWVTTSRRLGSHPACGPWSGSSSLPGAEAPLELLRSASGPTPVGS